MYSTKSSGRHARGVCALPRPPAPHGVPSARLSSHTTLGRRQQPPERLQRERRLHLRDHRGSTTAASSSAATTRSTATCASTSHQHLAAMIRRSIVGSSLEEMYIVPFVGSTAELPQFAPPLCPGNSIEPFMLGGVNNPSLREFASNWRAASFCFGSQEWIDVLLRERLPCERRRQRRKRLCRRRVFARYIGLRHGLVLRSAIGARPCLRFSTNRKPCFVGCATTSTFRPLCRTVRSFGAVGRS